MKNIPRMSRAYRRLLIRTGRKSGDPATALRFLVVARLGLGRSSVQVAQDVDLARSTVVEAAKRFASCGAEGLYDRRRFNGKRKAHNPFRRRVGQLLRRTPEDFGWTRPTWTRELLCLQMQRENWPSVAVCTMGRVLAQIGARRGTPKPVVLCPWPRDARERRIAELQALERRASERDPVLYEDEVDIHLNPKIGRDWMLPGAQRRVITPGKNRKFYIAGALDVCTGKLLTTGDAKKGASLFCELLRLVAAAYPRARRIHLILDNYVVHSATAVDALLKELGGRIVLHFLPPYCPDANRIERIWQDLHANVTRNHRCKTMNKLLSNARHYLTRYVWRAVTGMAPLLCTA